MGKSRAAFSSSSSSLSSTQHQTPLSSPGSLPFSMGWQGQGSRGRRGCCFATQASCSLQAAGPTGVFQHGWKPPVQSSQDGIGVITGTGGRVPRPARSGAGRRCPWRVQG